MICPICGNKIEPTGTPSFFEDQEFFVCRSCWGETDSEALIGRLETIVEKRLYPRKRAASKGHKTKNSHMKNDASTTIKKPL
jgi:ribosome-binding protein aMBF1 (putative translation factor)